MFNRDNILENPKSQILENIAIAGGGISGVEIGLGNTITNPIAPTAGKKKQSNQLKNWFFTWNNYPDNSVEVIETTFQKLCTRYIFQKEVGVNGTPHLQGTICLKKAMRWEEFKLPKAMHWEKTLNVEAAFEYCSKEETRDGLEVYRFPIIKEKAKLRIISELKPWQKAVLELIKDDIPDDRIIHWVYDSVGCMGKTVFSKYLYCKENAIITTGGAAKDIACLIALEEENGRDLNDKTTIIFNFPRSAEHISWKAIEMVKDGMMTSVKYQSRNLCFNSPHVICFSNEMPDISKLSADRWRIWNIIDDMLVPHMYENGTTNIINKEESKAELVTNYTLEDMYVDDPDYQAIIREINPIWS